MGAQASALDDAEAAQINVEPGAFAPRAWPFLDGALAGWQLTPQLVSAVGHNSNLRLQAAGARASVFGALLPSLTLARQDGEERRQWSWRSEWTHFADSPEDSTVNSELAQEGLTVLGPRTAMTWRLAWQDWHDAVAQPDPAVPAGSPDHFRVLALGGVWRHDLGVDARHRLELEPTLTRKRYLNHPDLTLQADADSTGLIVRYGHRWAEQGESRWGLESRWLRSRYPNNTQSLSNQDVRTLLTYDSDPDQPVTGRARVGWQQRRFDDLRPEQGLATWELEAQALPWAEGLLDVAFSRAAMDVPGEGSDAAVARRLQVAWTQRWTPNSHTTLSIGRTRSGYINFLPRVDTLRSVDLAWRVDLGRRWQGGLNVGWLQRRSDPADYSFARRLSSLVLTAAL